MKTTVSVDIEKELLTAAERYAAQRRLSLDQLIESFFLRLSIPVSQKNIVQLMREMEKPTTNEVNDLTQACYEEQKNKHGF